MQLSDQTMWNSFCRLISRYSDPRPNIVRFIKCQRKHEREFDIHVFARDWKNEGPANSQHVRLTDFNKARVWARGLFFYATENIIIDNVCLETDGSTIRVAYRYD